MAGGPLSTQKAEAAKKGKFALAGWGGTLLIGWFTHSAFLVVLGIGVSAWLTWSWFSYRAKWGMRF